MGRTMKFVTVCVLWAALLGLLQVAPLYGAQSTGSSTFDPSQRRGTALPPVTATASSEQKQPTPTPPAPGETEAEARSPIHPLLELSLPAAETNPSAARIFSAISPAVAFVETNAGTGSGLLIPGRYLLSNAHVVWPFSSVRVTFPDGSEFLDVPVIGWDLTADLALLGPVDTPLQPIGLVDGGQIEIGTDVYLIGYPAEVDDFPQPTITNGILSRYRKWGSIGYTFFQVDATITNGQSGGVMVNQHGDVVGISTFYYSSFGLAGSVADALPRLNAILGHETGVAINSRTFMSGETGRVFTDTLTSDADWRRYILQAPKASEVEMQVAGVGLPQIVAVALRSDQVESTLDVAQKEDMVDLSFELDYDEPYVIEIIQGSDNPNEYVLTSSHTLTLFADIDDGRPITIGDAYMGTIDTPLDEDHFELQLSEGDRIQVVVDALGLDPYLKLSYETETRLLLVEDDDSGGGIFGMSAKIVYEIPETGTYRLTVAHFPYSGDVGSYFLTISTPNEKAVLTEESADIEMLPSGYGPLGWYESEKYDFHILYPLDWEQLPGDQCPPQGAVLCVGSESALFFLTEESLASLPRRDRNRESYLRILEDVLSAQPQVKLLSAEPITTLQGLPADIFTFSVQGDMVRASRLAYVDEESGAAFGVSFVAARYLYPDIESLITMLMESFRVWTDEDREEDPAYHFDEATRLSARKQYDEAIESYSRALELNPGFVRAYERRASLHYRLGRTEDGLADLDAAIALDGDDADLYSGRAQMHWAAGDNLLALTELGYAIMLKPEFASYYNLKALVYVAMGDLNKALAAIDEIRDFSAEEELRPSIQDTLAYIYLKSGDVEKAKSEYDAIFARDSRFAYALLGGGVAYGLSGDEDQAAALIAEAMGLFEPGYLEFPDPQLTDLLEMAEPFYAASEE